MTARDETDTDEPHTTDDLTTPDPSTPGEPTDDRLTPMQPRHGPRPRRLA